MGGKRALDLALLLLTAPLSAPVIGLLALLVRICDGRPVFFGQARVGQGQRLFRIWKLRTLAGGPDPATLRPTRLGDWLRRRGLDELPQLHNVLRGEMSLVGPRPLTPDDAGRLVAEHPPFAERFSVPPGLTGLAQVCQARGAALTARLDMFYARQRSGAMDLGILARTAWMTLVGKRRGARPLPDWTEMSTPDSARQTARETLAALLAPRRLLPILLVCVPMLAAQGSFSRHRGAVLLGLAMCVAFVGAAPVSWRLLFPETGNRRGELWRLGLYAAIGVGTVGAVGVGLPRWMGLGVTFLTAPSSLAIDVALFLVGGWGLGRDIGFERSLARERARAESLAREAERAQLMALRAHLDPHFLFNTLNSIAEWCREDGVVAERAVLQLSAMLRTVLDGVRAPAWPLQTELELVETLFSLHLLRDPELFRFTARTSPELPADLRVPPMILLPLAENAVKHGPAAGHRGEITLELSRRGGYLGVRLENPGPYRGPRAGSDGLPMVERRLLLAYEGNAALRILGEGERTRVEMELPLGGPVEADGP